MKSVLWVPCYNEGTSEATYRPENGWPITEMRHTIYETLRLLRPNIISGTFGKVIISDDGSSDDTLEGVERFKREMDVRESVFQVIRGSKNEGKMMRFFEAFEQDNDADTFVMTDADMVFPGGSTMEKLSDTKSYPGERGMTISVQGEYSPQRRMYEMYDGATSGTRGLAVSRVKSRFNELGIGSNNIPGRGYGLELLLNKLFSHPFQAGEYVNNTAMGGNIPLFLHAFRKKSGAIQTKDIDYTLQTLGRLLNLR